MSTTHTMVVGRQNVTTTPSRKTIQKKIKTADASLEGFQMKPGYLYTVVRAISARINQNFDGWPSEELKRAAHTFVGKPVFVNHENFDPNQARGVVVASRYVENGNDKYIEVVQEIDAKRFPLLAHEIKTGGLDSVSMGAEAGFTICSYCNNRATDLHDMCDHVKYHKGEKLGRFNHRTGQREEVLVYESCHKISFFELSYVFDPADETAVASKVIMASAGRRPKIAAPSDEFQPVGDLTPGGMEGVDFAALEPMGAAGSMNGGAPKSTSDMIGDGLDAVSQGVSGAGGAIGDVDTAYNNFLDNTNDTLAGSEKWTGGADVTGISSEAPNAAQQINTPAPMQSFQARVLAALNARTAGECPPGQDCSRNKAEGEQIGPDTPNNPVNQGGGAAGASSGAALGTTPAVSGDLGKTPSQGGGGVGNDNIMDVSRPMYDALKSEFPDAEIGGYRPGGDGFDEHNNGALDFMTTDQAQFERGRDIAFENSAPYVMWQNNLYYPDGSIKPDTTPESGTAGHFDHFHTGPLQGQKAGARVAGKYNKDDFANALSKGKKPWESDGETERTKADPKEFEAKILREFMGGPPPPAKPMTGINPEPGMGPESYVVPYKGRGYQPGMPVDVYRNLHSEKTGTGLWSIRHQGRVVGHTDFVHMPGGKFFVGEGGNARVQETGQKNVHAGARGVLGPVPTDHDPSQYTGITYNPKAGHTSFIHRETQEPVWSADHIHLGQDGKAYTINPRGGQASPEQKSFEARVLEAWGEVEAPAAVDTLREEGSAPEDENDDFYHYVESPRELQTPDLSQANQIDREQAENPGVSTDMMGGVPGAMSEDAGAPALPTMGGDPGAQQPAGPPMMTLQIPMPPTMGQVPMQAYASVESLDYFDRYFGRRVANWMDAIEANRDFTPEESADYRRHAMNLSTLENNRELSTTSRNPMKGTANMASSTLAGRGKVAGRRQHFAEGPLVDGGDRSRNDQGEQEEVFISQTPAEEAVVAPTDDTPNISNTENNLVAHLTRSREKLISQAKAVEKYRSAKARGASESQALKYAGIRLAEEVRESGGPVATEVNPQAANPGSEELTGDNFESADPNAGVKPTNPHDASLKAFRVFDQWLAQKTGKSCRHHSEATIKRAAADFAAQKKISAQALFPALGIVLREARKNEKGAQMQKRAVDLEVAAPDGRVDVEAPTRNTTDAEAQASQFDKGDFGNNAGDNIAMPDLSTDQNWAPGEANKTSAKADAILAMRLVDAYVDAGLESANDRQRKYALAREFEGMNRGAVLDRIHLLERVAAVREAERRQMVASGGTRGAARSPIPAGLGQGGAPVRTASAQQRVAANDPRFDGLLFG